MTIKNLSNEEMLQLINSVFQPKPSDTGIALIIDVPNKNKPDNAVWKERRNIAIEWFSSLSKIFQSIPMPKVAIYYYENVGNGGGDLPEVFYEFTGNPSDINIEIVSKASRKVSGKDIFSNYSIIIAPTEFSATAPLKILAKSFPFRAATLPGFTKEMIPALGLNYEKVNERVMFFKDRLDKAEGLNAIFKIKDNTYECNFDLRDRTAHASSGLLRELHIAGNLPSGEAYIVPNEGEKIESKTNGILPVEREGEIILYHIKKNRIDEILSSGNLSNTEKDMLKAEPAYGNIAEVGIGVLGEFGVNAVGSVLLDEKLGFHIAFGRSDHFGGITSPSSFNSPENVIHIDWVYTPSLQPNILLQKVEFIYPNDKKELFIENNKYMI